MSRTALMLMLSLATGRLRSTEEDMDVTRKLHVRRKGCGVNAAPERRMRTTRAAGPSAGPASLPAHALLTSKRCRPQR